MSGSGVLVDGWEPNFGVIPTILYCALITITIFPFSFINIKQVEHIGNIHRIFLYVFTGFILIQGLTIFLLTGSFLSTLLQGDFKYIKDAGYAGDITPADAMMMTMPLPIQMMYLTCTITLLGIPLFFYYTGVEKKSLWKTAPILAVSISPVLRGILSADRTEIIHYGLMFLFSLVFFQRFITKGMKKFLLLTTIPTLAIGIVYIIAVSTSRFENTEEGASGSMLEYAGQSYVNFCYFYDYHDRELYYIEREFPMTSYFIFKDQYTDTKEERSAKEGFFIGVFASHVGSWFLDTGAIGSLLICIVFAVICCLVIKRYNRTEFDIADVIMIFTLGAVPTFGIFYYRYYSIATAFVYVAAGILYLFSKYIFVWEKEQELTKI
jgi:oligosaccharide repeat unit polymerase